MNIKEGNILITGATGFLGSHLVRKLHAEGFNLIGLKRYGSSTHRLNDLMKKITFYDADRDDIASVFKRHQIHAVINTVADYGRDTQESSAVLEANLMFPLKIIEYCVKYKVGVFINTDTLLDKSTNSYSLSKHQLVSWMLFYKDKINMVNVKVEHMFGPLDNATKMPYWILGQLMKNVEQIELTEGNQKRDFIYIDDVISAYIKIIEQLNSFSSFEEFELGTGSAVDVKYFIEALKNQFAGRQKTNTILNFGVIPYRENEIMKIQACISRLQLIGWEPKVTLNEGIIKLVDNFLLESKSDLGDFKK